MTNPSAPSSASNQQIGVPGRESLNDGHRRVTDRGLHLPTVTMRHAERTITLIGVMHTGPQQAWADVQRLLDRLEAGGSVVHFEGLNSAASAPWHARRKMRLFAAMSRRMNLVFDAMGFVNQAEALSYPPRWKHHDLGSTTVFAAFRYLHLLRLRLLVSLVTSRPFRKIMTTAFLTQLLTESSNDEPETGLAALFNQAVVLDARNLHAVNAALQEDGDVVLLWGAAHLPGMIQLLGEAGFEQTTIDWRLHVSREHALEHGVEPVGDNGVGDAEAS